MTVLGKQLLGVTLAESIWLRGQQDDVGIQLDQLGQLDSRG